MLRFWELAPSPNSIKVRMALRFKGIAFEVVPVDTADRRPVLALSGQEHTPVIEDRGIVLNDSEAILQFLDGNYRDAPRLYPADGPSRRTCDAWKSRLDRELARPWLPVFMHAIRKGPPDDAREREAFVEGLRALDRELEDPDAFCSHQAVCDLRVAQWAVYGLPGPGLIRRVPLFAKLKERFAVPDGALPNLERFLVPWNERLE